MAFVRLDVPFVSQNEIGSHVKGAKTHSEQNGCWYASTCMIGYFWEYGPRLGVPEQYKKGWVDSIVSWFKYVPSDPKPMGSRYKDLKENEGFKGCPLPSANKWTADGLMKILTDHGPCYVRRGFRDAKGNLSGGHAIVLAGANKGKDEVVCLDPWETTKDKGTVVYSLADFNDFFKWDESWEAGISLMYKQRADPAAAKQYIVQRMLKTWP
jgi:hypothetical protein